MIDRKQQGLIVGLLILGSIVYGQSPSFDKVHPSMLRILDEMADNQSAKAWVLFTDKGLNTQDARRAAFRDLEATYSQRAIERRRNRRDRPGLFDEHDLPVADAYLRAVAETGAQLRQKSKWVNAVSVVGTRQQLADVSKLTFVRMVQPVRRGRKIEPTSDVPIRRGTQSEAVRASISGVVDYGQSYAQLAQINLIALHQMGFTGAGVMVGILDTGFEPSHVAFNEPGHPLSIVAEWDFINNDGNAGIDPGDPSSQHSHGTYILGTLGAYKPGELVGAAFDASFILCKTEDTTGEYQGEEDNYVAGLEFIEAHGGDLATSSLSYSDWYTSADMDGMTAVTTLAVNIATANGLYCCTSAGNAGHDSDPATFRLGAPADALDVLTCGAVSDDGSIASFSSDGPTADGRVKPEVLARGVDTRTVSASNDTDYRGVDGTSLSTPLIAGAVACLVQAHPTWTVDQMRLHLFTTASDYVLNQTFDSLYVRGYGVIDAYAAAQEADCNDNGIDDTIDIVMGTSDDVDNNLVPDECKAPVPAISQWGFVVMTLLLFTIGTTILARRPHSSNV